MSKQPKKTRVQIQAEIATRVAAGQSFADLIDLIQKGGVEGEGGVQLNVTIPESLDKRMREAIKSRGMTRRAFVSKALEDAIQRDSFFGGAQ